VTIGSIRRSVSDPSSSHSTIGWAARARDIAAFDAAASVVESLRTAIDRASPEQLRELIGMLVEKIKVTEDGE
jgi:hypothetical protein